MTDLVLRSRGKRYPVTIEQEQSGKLIFRRSPFSMKDEIKAMKGSRWDPTRRCWSVANHPRNHFQINAMMVEPDDPKPYAWFERDLLDLDVVERPIREHQIEMIRKALTYRYQIFAADMGLGKTLIAIEVMERLARQYGWDNDCRDQCWFVGPKSALESVDLDMHKWGVNLVPRTLTYERFVIDHAEYLDSPPQLIFFDESSNLKTPSSRRASAAQKMTDRVREVHGTDGGVVLLSGTTVSKRPSDIWSQAEITWPGFLREGSIRAFEDRYATVVLGEDSDGNKFRKIDGWKDHEVSRLSNRLDGLMSVYLKKDWLNLPERTFVRRVCEVQPRTKRVAKALVDAAPNTISGLTALRALSSGFQYNEDGDAGEQGERAIVETVCPKDDVLREIIDEEQTRGRMIVFASFQGSIDRVKRICHEQGWDTIVVDGRGWNCYDKDNVRVKQHILDYWANNPNPTVFVGNPASCRFGLTLVEAKTTVVFDQNFSAEHRLQSLDRNYRIGQTDPVRVIDLLHLPVDELILDTLVENKRLEDLSLGLLLENLE